MNMNKASLKAPMAVSENMQYYRKKAGLSQKELAEKLNCPVSVISNCESGYCTPNVVLAANLCLILNITFEMLSNAQEE